MPRPCKCRKVDCSPKVNCFKPMKIPLSALKEIKLKIDEFEALRLADLEGMYQKKAAEQMNVSRQTFGNIIKSAHKKIADAIINGKIIKIEGGVYRVSGKRNFKCAECSGSMEADRVGCPLCESGDFQRTDIPRDCAEVNGKKRN